MYGDAPYALDAATGEIEWSYDGIGRTGDAVTVKDGRDDSGGRASTGLYL
jgi:hypothetical protein